MNVYSYTYLESQCHFAACKTFTKINKSVYYMTGLVLAMHNTVGGSA